MRHGVLSRLLVAFLLAGPLTLGGCGDDDEERVPAPTPTPSPTPQPTAFLIPALPGATPEANWANAISADGRVVVGYSDSAAGQQAFRWTTDGQLQGLGLLSGYGDRSEADALSADGSVVVGTSFDGDGSARAFIWTASTSLQPLGDLEDYFTWSDAAGISADGTVVVGTVTGIIPSYEDEKTLCYRWTAADGFEYFGDFLPAGVDGTYCVARAVSANGRVIVGEARYDVQEPVALVQGFRRTSETGTVPLGWVDANSPQSGAYSASANGSVIGGFSNFKMEIEVGGPMRWTTTSGPVWLAVTAVGVAHAVSADGSAMARGAADPGTAFVWDVDNGYRNLYGLLEVSGLAGGLDDTAPVAVSGMTADGRVVVGGSMGETGRPRAFYVQLP